MSQRDIVVRGAREHNLKGIDVTIPRGSLTTVTGVSGSGKSSLAFDTIQREGQRRYVESLSAYARQFLGQCEKPRVDHVEGLSPTVSIDQKSVNSNPRSTVGTITEVHDHLRLLFARLGTPHCVQCGKPVQSWTADGIVERIVSAHNGRQVTLLGTLIRERKGEYRKELEALRTKGYVRARIDGEIRRLDEPIELARYERHSIEVVLDRVRVATEQRARVAEAVQAGLALGLGEIVVCCDAAGEERCSTMRACPDCNTSLTELEPRLFSFNSPQGACVQCDGLGESGVVDLNLVVPDRTKSIEEGAVAPSRARSFSLRWQLQPDLMLQVCKALKIRTTVPFAELKEREQQQLFHGALGKNITLNLSFKSERIHWSRKEKRVWRGVLPILGDYSKKEGGKAIVDYVRLGPCPDCNAARLKPEALSVKFRERNIHELASLTVSQLAVFVDGLVLDSREQLIGQRLFQELRSRLVFLERVGLGYLCFTRGAATLSGGESQRIRLATQVGSQLRGVLYVLDEPSIGLHPRDNQRLISTLKDLRDAGNTVLVVEHDEETMASSDYLLDLGPGAGCAGGELLAAGTPRVVAHHPRSVTGAWLRHEKRMLPPASRRVATGPALRVLGARAHNLKAIDVTIPAGLFVCVTGVSGSGKSTLVDDILRPALARHYHAAKAAPLAHDSIEGLEHFDKVVEIDQSPIGRTSRSNPATYTGVFDDIRALFADLPEAKVRGWKKGRFSFNVAGGRCEECEGAGVKYVEMHFLADVAVVCNGCDGRRFTDATLELQWRGKTIAAVLDMTVTEALEFFAAQPRIRRGLQALEQTGLGYVQLGQPSTTLSGGEAQRIKLATELQRPATGRTLYLLDEPTTGLHFADVARLVTVLQALVQAGNTMVVIEHNLDVIQNADWVIDLGPEGGDGGGSVMWQGPFEGVLQAKGSHTGVALARHLGRTPLLAEPMSNDGASLVRDRSLDGDVRVVGATLHNLKVEEARFPAGKMSVVTGLSGSGKTSLAFDTLFAEGQRRFVECLSTYARQFLGRLERPPVEAIHGLAPAIAIDQKTTGRSPRSTVATATEIQDYLRLLFARLGTAHCPACGVPLQASTPESAAQRLLRECAGQRGRVLAPLLVASLGIKAGLERAKDLSAGVESLKAAGWRRVLLDGIETDLDKPLPAMSKVSDIWLVLDRVAVKPDALPRLREAFEVAFTRSAYAAFMPEKGAALLFSSSPACMPCGTRLPEEPTPRHFSFNSHHGACTACKGLGETQSCDPAKLIEHPEKALFDGALVERPGDFLSRSDSWFRTTLTALAKKSAVDLKQPWNKLPKKFRDAVLYGSREDFGVNFEGSKASRIENWEMKVTWKGLCRYVEEWQRTSDSPSWVEQLEPLLRHDACASCSGERLQPIWRSFRTGGRTLGDVTRMTVDEALLWVAALRSEFKPDAAVWRVAEQLVTELDRRLNFLARVGLSYLSLGRSAATLSGGEAQRIRLATQIGNQLSGVLYVLDEPTIGLHPRDTQRLLGTLKSLCALGNTLVVVEHDRDTIAAADWLVDLGPGAGHHGGRVVWQGPAAAVNHSDTLTAKYLTGRAHVSVARERRKPRGLLRLQGARANNLKNVSAEFPLGCLTAVTGVSGSGKSSLVMSSLAVALGAIKGQAATAGKVKGVMALGGTQVVDQAPLGSSPRSNPASHLGILDRIRDLFSEALLAKQRGYGPGRFSFNTREGRCQACEGRGSVLVEMHFLPDVEVGCEHCKGQRYNRETLDVHWRGKSIADVLGMEAEEAAAFFAGHERIAAPLRLLVEIGLGYIRLGQSATTLSGGEAQRLKLAAELACRGSDKLFLLDEPTTGLHFEDVRRLLCVLHRLVERGHSVVVIEHNMEVVADCDHVIDMGPEGGDAGGELLASGTPEQLAECGSSDTGRALQPLLRALREEHAFGSSC